MQIGDPSPSGEHQEFPVAHTQFKEYVEGDQTLQPWYEFLLHASELQKQGKKEDLQALSNKVANAYRELFRQTCLLLPQVEWVQDSGIHRVTGHDLSLPVMVFDRDTLPVYRNIHGGTPQGISAQIRPELVGLPANARPLSLVSVPAEEFDYAFPMPYDQRRRHELMHAADPNINRRTGIEYLIQTELAATIGENTDNGFIDTAIVNISPSFLLSYLRKSAPQYATQETAKRLVEYVRKITAQRQPTGRRSNAEIVRDLMLTRENQELRGVIIPDSNRPRVKFTKIT